ncbi:Reticulocyte-binding protein 2-like protein a [Frankliniella fusca]|uniref:Reticulocyte-binding protein 2-like protein a n=1 Tax=Frankliniella fusca TaxID=407009 RepID=A0AAE1H8T2_9NEOP|nr:Reticulocyte-binding protein 2-like protein a [Frankliniella fusca]
MDFMRVHRAVVDTGRLKLHLDSPDQKSQVCCPFTLQASADAGKFGANSVFVVARSAVTIELQPLGSIVCPALLQGVAQVCEDRISTARVLRAQCVLESDGSVVTMDGVHTVPMVPVVRNVVSPDGTWVSSEEATGGATSFCPEAVSPGRGSADRQDFGATPPNFQSRNFGCPNDAHDREVDRALYSFTLGLVQPSPLIDQRQCILVPGVVPFAPGTIELELENPTVNHVVIPRGSVVALVHPVGFADLQKFEPLDPSDFSAADRVGHPHSVTVASATVESVPPTDQADIQLEPRLPPLALDEALPEDLQALADRLSSLRHVVSCAEPGAALPGVPRPAAKTAERAARDRASWAKFRARTKARRAQEREERQRAQERAERQRAQQQQQRRERQRREQQRAPRRPAADQVRQAAPRRPAADLSRQAAPRRPAADAAAGLQQQTAPPQPPPDVLGQLVEGFNALAAQVHALHQRQWQQAAPQPPQPQWPSWPQGPAGPPGFYRPF